MSTQVKYAVKLASMGLTPDKVLESSLTFHPGARIRAKVGTSGMKEDGSTISIPEGTVMTVIGVGGGQSGVDPLVQLPSGEIVNVPFDQVMEGVKLRRRGRKSEGRRPSEGRRRFFRFEADDSDDDMKKKKEKEKKDKEREKEKKDQNEDLTGAVASVTLAKPLPDGAKTWLEAGHMDYGVMLSMSPTADSAAAVSFLMKADDEDMLMSALELLKKIAGASFKSSKDATLMDWEQAHAA